MAIQGLQAGTRLPDFCTEFFAFVLELAQADHPGESEQLRVRVNQFFDQIRAQGLQIGHSEGGLNQAKYAMCALVDEVVLTSNWPIKDAWMARPLQMEHFNNFAAGEQFFQRLHVLRTIDDPRRAELVEVYTLCLCFGFKGKHGGVQGMETLRKLRAELITELEGAKEPPVAAPSQGAAVSARDVAIGRQRRKTDKKELSPAWRSPSQVFAKAKDLPVRVVVVACLALLILIYALLAFILGMGSSAVLEGMG